MTTPIAEKSMKNPGDQGEDQLVVFTLAGCELGVPIRQVREIIRVPEITLMPKAPLFLEGIINLRGRVVPVLDLRKRFGMPLVAKTHETRVLVLELKDQILGLLVDKVAEVLRVPPEGLQPADGPLLNLDGDFIGGLVPLNDRLIVVFKAEKVFHFEEWKALPEWEQTVN